MGEGGTCGKFLNQSAYCIINGEQKENIESVWKEFWW